MWTDPTLQLPWLGDPDCGKRPSRADSLRGAGVGSHEREPAALDQTALVNVRWLSDSRDAVARALTLIRATRTAAHHRRRRPIGLGARTLALVRRVDPRGHGPFAAASVCLIVALAGGVGWIRSQPPGAAPNGSALFRLYASGLSGAATAGGDRAPAAHLVGFAYQGRAECTLGRSTVECLQYRYAAPDTHPGLEGSIWVAWNGSSWVLASAAGTARGEPGRFDPEERRRRSFLDPP